MTLDALRQKALNTGLKGLTTAELLALVANIELPIANYLLEYGDGIEGLAKLSPAELMTVEGIGQAKALSISAALALCHHLNGWHGQRITLRRPEDAARLVLQEMSAQMQEELRVILVDSRNGVMDVQTVYIGSLNATVVRVAEIFRPAILVNAAGIIIAHNHPTGDPTPSPQDIQLTQAVSQAGQQLDIPLLDHLIIAGGQWVSLREKNLGFD